MTHDWRSFKVQVEVGFLLVAWDHSTSDLSVQKKESLEK